MRLALITQQALAVQSLTLALEANAMPPRDRTSRTDKALTHCKGEWTRAHALAQQKGLTATKALRMASVAYKLAMPKMDSLPTIRASIACIAQGITLEVFDGRDGSQLLYAAQVALSVLRQKGAK
jgi:predicted lipoprotein with Yx(FWY)xxD motif